MIVRRALRTPYAPTGEQDTEVIAAGNATAQTILLGQLRWP